MYIGVSTNNTINMNMFCNIRRNTSIHICVGITESISIRKRICNHTNQDQYEYSDEFQYAYEYFFVGKLTLILKLILMNTNIKKHTNAGIDTNTNNYLLLCIFALASVLV